MTQRTNPEAFDEMLAQLIAVGAKLNPSIVEPRERKRLLEFINAFLEDAMGMEALDLDEIKRVVELVHQLENRGLQ